MEFYILQLIYTQAFRKWCSETMEKIDSINGVLFMYYSDQVPPLKNKTTTTTIEIAHQVNDIIILYQLSVK